MPDAVADEIIRRRNAGERWRAIADAVGKAETSCRDIYRRHGKQTPVGPHFMPAVPKSALDEMRRAADDADGGEEETDAELWEREKKASLRHAKRIRDNGTFRWSAPGKHVLLSFLSDQHVGDHADYAAMQRDAELIASTPNCYAVLGGDGVDNHLKHRGAVLNQRMRPGDQYRLFEYYMRIFGDRLLAMVSGNHDDWTGQFAGIDLMSRLARDNRIFYNPSECYIDARVGATNYTIGLRHQFRMNSSFNQTHAVKQWLRLGVRPFDIGVVCHHHEAAIEETMYRGQPVWVARPGAYQGQTSYSSALGYNPATPTCPTFLLRGDRRAIYGWNSVRAAVDCVGALREIGV